VTPEQRAILMQAISRADHYRTLLRKSLQIISKGDTLATWLADMDSDLHTLDDMGERLYANAAIVGVLGVMLEVLEMETTHD
jgi:hypothetical protein